MAKLNAMTTSNDELHTCAQRALERVLVRIARNIAADAEALAARMRRWVR